MRDSFRFRQWFGMAATLGVLLITTGSAPSTCWDKEDFGLSERVGVQQDPSDRSFRKWDPRTLSRNRQRQRPKKRQNALKKRSAVPPKKNPEDVVKKRSRGKPRDLSEEWLSG